jgi:outer membrane protein assembly factor BamB
MFTNRLFHLSIVVILLALTACTPQIELPAATLETSPSEIASLPTSTPTSLLEILPTPSLIIPFGERLLAEINIKIGPDEIVFAQGFIWIKTDNGHVVQVDPATNVVVGEIKVDTTSDIYHYCQGLGTDGQNIWACSASGEEDNKTINVVRVDPQTQSIVETFKVGKIFDQLEMPFLLNQIWVLSGGGDKLVGIDVTTNQPSPAIELGTRCFQLAVVDQMLMATCALDNLVLQIDPAKREVTARVTVKSPRFIAGTENGLWVVQDNAVVRLDPISLQPIIVFTQLSNVGISGDIFVTEDSVWLSQESGFLYRIDPASNRIIEQIQTDQSISSGTVLVTSDSIWTTDVENNRLIRISLN